MFPIRGSGGSKRKWMTNTAQQDETDVRVTHISTHDKTNERTESCIRGVENRETGEDSRFARWGKNWREGEIFWNFEFRAEISSFSRFTFLIKLFQFFIFFYCCSASDGIRAQPHNYSAMKTEEAYNSSMNDNFFVFVIYVTHKFHIQIDLIIDFLEFIMILINFFCL